MLKFNPELTDELAARWSVDFLNWKSHMGFSPTAVPSDLLLAASGVDGRHQGALKRYMGHWLLEDMARAPMRGDLNPTSWTHPLADWYNPSTFVPALQVAPSVTYFLYKFPHLGPFIRDVHPFSVSAHQSNRPGQTVSGFVLRMDPNCLKLPGTSDPPPAAGPPVVALLLLADNVNQPLGDQSRFRLVLPMVPNRTVYWRKGQAYYNQGDTESRYRSFPKGLSHYEDFDSWRPGTPGLQAPSPIPTPETAVPATTFITANDPIAVTYNGRFIYIFSTTGEFNPVTVWYDPAYGIQRGQDTLDPDDWRPVGMSSRSYGWHWEPFGVELTADNLSDWLDTGTSVYQAGSTGYALEGQYQMAYRLFDFYRGRYTSLSKRFNMPAVSAGGYFLLTTWRPNGATPTAPPFTGVWVDMMIGGWTHYQTFWTMKGTQPGGSLYNGDTFGMRNSFAPIRGWRMLTNWNLAGDAYGLHERMWRAEFFRQGARTDDQSVYFASDPADKSPTTDLYLATQTAYDSNQEPGDTPTTVLDAASFKGLTVLAVPRQNSTQSVSQTPEGVVKQALGTASYVAIRWSAYQPYAPEVLPVGNVLHTRVRSDRPLRLIVAGDFLYLVGEGPLTRFAVLETGDLAMQEVAQGLTLPHRQCVADVRGLLAIMLPDGLQLLEPNTGALQNVAAVDRIISDYWGDLQSVRLAYDQGLDALYILNTARQSIVIVWMKGGTVTCLDGVPFSYLATIDIEGLQRVVLIHNRGRFVVPRRYEHERPECNFGMMGMVRPTGVDSPWLLQVKSVSLSLAEDFTYLELENYASLEKVFRRDGRPYELNIAQSDPYNWGVQVTSLAGDSYGQSYEVVNVKNETTLSKLTLTVKGNQSASIRAGDWLALDSIPFGVLFGPLESDSDETSGTRKRQVHTLNAVVPWAVGPTVPAGVPVFELGVVDYTSLKAHEPQPAGQPVWRTGSTDLEKSRRVFVPRGGQAYNPVNPQPFFGYVGASGNLLWPYVRCLLPDWRFELQNFTVRGTISPSDSILPEGG